MEFIVNVDLNELLEKEKLKISKVDKLIESKKKDLVEMEKFRNDLLKEASKIVEKINKSYKKEDKFKKNKVILNI